MARLRLLAVLTATLPLLAACGGEPPDISEAKARSIAEKELDNYCGGEGGKCTDYYSKGTKEPADPRFKWAFHYLSEFTDPRRLLVIMVGRKGETSVTLTRLAPPTEEEMAANAAAAAALLAAPAEGAPPAEAPPGEAPPGS